MVSKDYFSQILRSSYFEILKDRCQGKNDLEILKVAQKLELSEKQRGLEITVRWKTELVGYQSWVEINVVWKF